MIRERIAKGLSYSDIASQCILTQREPFSHYHLTEAEIFAYEVFDFLPADFYTMLRLATTIREASASKKSNAMQSIRLPGTRQQVEKDLLGWKIERERLIADKYTLDAQSWWAAYGDSPDSWCSAFEKKILNYQQDNSTRVPLDDCVPENFSEALIMWRLGKKWSYKQLADQVGIDWIELWGNETNGYYGALFAIMLEIAEVVEHRQHEPSDHSFAPVEA
jgi:transcriptional regulator with XRE-family HTH domain